MTDEPKNIEPSEEPKRKPAPKRKPTAKKKTARTIKNLTEAITVLTDMNVPYSKDMDDVEIIALAENTPIEDWYKIEIQPKGEFDTKQAYVRVNGKSWHLERGVVHEVPARVVRALENGEVKTVDMIDTPTGKKIVERTKRDEVFSVLEKIPNPKV